LNNFLPPLSFEVLDLLLVSIRNIGNSTYFLELDSDSLDSIFGVFELCNFGSILINEDWKPVN